MQREYIHQFESPYDADFTMVGDERRDQVKSDLIRIASADFFEATSTDSFRKELAQSLRLVVDACRVCVPVPGSSLSIPSVTRYDVAALGECLSSVDWKGLCSHNDRVKSRTSENDDVPGSTTSLDEMLSSLQNPYVWPFACARPILETLIQTLTSQRSVQKTAAYRSIWTPSQQCILQTLTTLCRSIPAARTLPATILSSAVAGTRSIHGLNALLSLAKCFCKEFPSNHLFYLKCILEILQSLDDMDIQKHGTRRRGNPPRLSPSDERPTRRPQASSACATVDLLHGEISECDESRLAMSIAKRKKFPRAPPKPYFRSILTAPSIDSGLGSAPEQAGDRLRLRSKCINTFVATCQKSTRTSPSLLLCVLDSLTPLLVGSPSVRLCSILLADQQSNKTFGYTRLCQYWWSHIHELGSVSLYLLAYAELIVECSYFDAYDTCSSAVGPLLGHLRKCCAQEMDPNRESARPYLRCFAYILSRRGKMLATLPEFASLLALLSVSFDQPSDWIGSGISPDERARTMQTLQLAGILGVCDDIEATVYEAAVHGLSPDQVAFPPSICIRDSARQIPLVPPPLFSKLSPVNGAPPMPSGVTPCVPMMEYVNEDILHNLFTFFGYKRIVRMRSVSKEWKSVADSNQLWRSAYHSRYGILPDDKLAQSVTAPWKTYFRDKWLAEREIGFRRSKNGWKARLCGFVECMHVLKSKAQLQKHYATHQAEKRKRSPKKKQPDDHGQTTKRQCK
jgi:hypothetical protein